MDGQVTDDDVTWESHKSIAQINCTNESWKEATVYDKKHITNAQNDHAKQDDVMSRNGNDEQHFWMLQSSSGAYGGPENG